MKLSDMVTQSILARFCAIMVLAVAMILAIIVAFVDLLQGRDIPEVVRAFLYAGFGLSITVIGLNIGVVLKPMPQKEVTGEL